MNQRILTRMTNRLHELFVHQHHFALSQQAVAATRISERNAIIARLVRQLRISAHRKWWLAYQRVRMNLARQVVELQHDLDNGRRALARIEAVPSLRTVSDELRQLAEEFGVVRFGSRVVAVETEPITLEDVYLGPFEIILADNAVTTGELGDNLTIKAIDPNPAASNDSVTHPHVSDCRLCTGDAGASLNEALRAGRICDLFLIVRSVLATYNSDSPYVTLAAWNGRACDECGHVGNPDDSYWCEHCENMLCDDCCSTCRSCEEVVCGGCGSSCPSCGDNVCPGCLSSCVRCRNTCCLNCLDENICTTCLEQENDDESETNEDCATPGCGSALHADGVGQAAVLLPPR